MEPHLLAPATTEDGRPPQTAVSAVHSPFLRHFPSPYASLCAPSSPLPLFVFRHHRFVTTIVPHSRTSPEPTPPSPETARISHHRQDDDCTVVISVAILSSSPAMKTNQTTLETPVTVRWPSHRETVSLPPYAVVPHSRPILLSFPFVPFLCTVLSLPLSTDSVFSLPPFLFLCVSLTLSRNFRNFRSLPVLLEAAQQDGREIRVPLIQHLPFIFTDLFSFKKNNKN